MPACCLFLLLAQKFYQQFMIIVLFRCPDLVEQVIFPALSALDKLR
jgi:hypothetical protein